MPGVARGASPGSSFHHQCRCVGERVRSALGRTAFSGEKSELPNSVRPEALRSLGPSLGVIAKHRICTLEILVFVVHKERSFPLST